MTATIVKHFTKIRWATSRKGFPLVFLYIGSYLQHFSLSAEKLIVHTDEYWKTRRGKEVTLELEKISKTYLKTETVR